MYQDADDNLIFRSVFVRIYSVWKNLDLRKGRIKTCQNSQMWKLRT